MTSETFGLYVGVIYIQKGIELLTREFSHSATDGWLSVVVAISFALTVYWVEKIRYRGQFLFAQLEFVGVVPLVFWCVSDVNKFQK
jgi:hypothetical protein